MSLRGYCALLVSTGLCLQLAFAEAPHNGQTTNSFRAMIEADWATQEQRKNRTPGDPAALRDAYQRAQRLLDDLGKMGQASQLTSEAESLKNIAEQVNKTNSLDEAARLDLYRNIRSITRQTAFKNPLVTSNPMVFMKRRRFICQMLHEYLAYFYDYGDIEGGGVYVLEEPGRSPKVRDLINGRLPRGNYTTLALSYDAKTIYFAFAERAAEKPDYYSPQRQCFHIYAMDAGGANLRRLTDGPNDDFDPCPLPDGGVAFMSTRRGGFGRCHNPWEPLPSYTLHRMDASGGQVQRLSFHETNEWHPSVLADGRIAYCRWDYVDRSAANYHGLWASNPDGTNPIILFGNYTQRINACYQPHSIPGSNRIIFVAGAHHADVGGSLVIFDPARGTLDPQSGQDQFDAIETLTPEVCFPEAPGWPSSYFHGPWPLSENYFLVAFSFEPLPGMGPKVQKDTTTGLYYLDRFGNMELLYRDTDISSMYPIPLARRPAPPQIPSTLETNHGDEGEFMLADVKQSLFPLPASRKIRQLRIFQVLPKTSTHVANKPRLGYANAESARMMLGTVPVEPDGSAFFRAPARKPLYFQALDETGRAVQTMRSITYLQPGERRSCLGCHEPRGTTPANRPAWRGRPGLASRWHPASASEQGQDALATALQRPPSTIVPGPDGTHPFSYPRLVQPVLDKHCVHCHDGQIGDSKSRLLLTGKPAGTFSQSYQSLKPYVRWYEWGDSTITEVVTRPGRIGADESPLLNVLMDSTHAKHVALPQEDRLRLYIWLDGNASFYGVYEEAQQVAQQSGQAVPPPSIQ